LRLKKKSTGLAEISLRPNAVIPFFSEGNWNLYQLLSHVLRFTGKAMLKISSYSISEEAIRSLLEDENNDRIHTMVLLFDITIPNRKLDQMLFAYDRFSEIRLRPNHSKVIIIEGDKNNAVILSSQNLTKNPRLEAGCIFTTDEHFLFYNKMFDKYFKTSIPFNPYNERD